MKVAVLGAQQPGLERGRGMMAVPVISLIKEVILGLSVVRAYS